MPLGVSLSDKTVFLEFSSCQNRGKEWNITIHIIFQKIIISGIDKDKAT